MNDFSPNWVSAPGETILDLMQEKRLSVKDFAQKIGESVRFTDDLINGSIQINTTLAKKLENTIGGSEYFWITRENQYRSNSDRLKKVKLDWEAKFPLKDMIAFGWINPQNSSIYEECLNFFGSKSINDWEKKYGILDNVAFKRSHRSNIGSLLAWLRRGEIVSKDNLCEPWDIQTLKENIPIMRKLITNINAASYLVKLKDICSKCGIALEFVRAPKGCMASGAAKFVSKNKALILISFRYLTDDHFWFTFFHEIGHLLLHDATQSFIDEGEYRQDSEIEAEANNFAQNLLVPENYHSRLNNIKLNQREIIKLSIELGITPGIIIGQLQFKRKIDFSQLNIYKRKINLTEIPFS